MLNKADEKPFCRPDSIKSRKPTVSNFEQINFGPGVDNLLLGTRSGGLARQSFLVLNHCRCAHDRWVAASGLPGMRLKRQLLKQMQ
jgi:hypothetical protein